MPVCAFETENAVFISCIPEWERELKDILTDAATHEAIPKMKEYIEKQKNGGVGEYHNLYGLEELNPLIDTSKAVLLGYDNYDQYWNFCKRTNPYLYELIGSDTRIVEIYNDMVNKEIHFCVIEDNEIVSLTNSEELPNKPDGIINLGINTLKEHRRKGNAAHACAAFIKHNVKQGLMPVWRCDIENSPSQLLAKKLGFRYLGNVFSVSTLVESWQ